MPRAPTFEELIAPLSEDQKVRARAEAEMLARETGLSMDLAFLVSTGKVSLTRARARSSERRWREKNPDSAREIRRNYVEKHKEAVRASRRKYNEKNRSAAAERSAKWREENQEKAKAVNAEYNRRRREKRRAKREQENPLEADVARLRARQAQHDALLREARAFVDRHSEPWYTSGQELLARIDALLSEGAA